MVRRMNSTYVVRMEAEHQSRLFNYISTSKAFREDTILYCSTERHPHPTLSKKGLLPRR